jgi:hypothetical protein
MNMVEAYLQILEEGYYEVTFAFGGLADEHVWKRPSERLLSIGEIAGHIAYWEAVKFAGEGGDPPDPAKCRVKSPLVDARFRYYTTSLQTTPSTELLAMTATDVCQELLRVHKEAMADFKSRDVDIDTSPPGWPPGRTYRMFLTYAAFHVAYHTGQMYTLRHLLEELPPDN